LHAWTVTTKDRERTDAIARAAENFKFLNGEPGVMLLVDCA
jgi:hypothetical protein